MIDHAEAGALLSEMVRIARTLRQAGQRSREQSLTGTKHGFLQCLRDAGESRLGELAQRLVVTAPVASRAADALEADGLIARHPDPHDARAALITITDDGRTRLAESERRVVALFADSLSDWNGDDAADAALILGRLAATLDDVMGQASPHQTTSHRNESHA